MTLYEQDFAAWINHTAELIRQHKWEEIDLAALVEEVESLGRSERREIKSRLIVLLLHLLKWKYQQQGYRSERSWKASIGEARTGIELVIDDSPSLRDYPKVVLDSAYAYSLGKAARETNMTVENFPGDCPFTIEEILNPDYLPTRN